MIKNNFKTLLKELRVVKGISQKELAEAIGTSPAIISKYESGKAQPRAEATTKLAEVLGVAASVFFEALELPQSSLVEIDYLFIDTTKAGGLIIERDKNKQGILISEQEFKQNGFSNLADLGAYKNKGDAMSPFILNGDSVILDLSEDEVIDGNVYLVTYKGQEFLKIIRNDFTTYRLESVNDRSYPEILIDVNTEDFAVIGKMIWRGGFYR